MNTIVASAKNIIAEHCENIAANKSSSARMVLIANTIMDQVSSMNEEKAARFIRNGTRIINMGDAFEVNYSATCRAITDKFRANGVTAGRY